MIIRVPAPALPYLRPGLRLAGPARPVSALQRRPGCSCRGTRSPCCAAPIPGPGSTGPTAQSSPHSSGSCQQGCGCTGWSPPAPSCAGTAAWSPASGPTRAGRDGRRSALRSPRSSSDSPPRTPSGVQEDPRRAPQARPPGWRIHHPPGPQGPEDPTGTETAHRHDLADVSAYPGIDDARHRLLPRRLRNYPPAPVLLVRHRSRPPLPAHSRRDREPGRAVDHTADPEPPDGSRRSRRRFPIPGPRPGRAVHRVLRRSPGQRRYRSSEDPAQKPSREHLCGKVRTHRPDRGHRPAADLRPATSANCRRAARRARSAQFSCRRHGCGRCRTASWWRRIKISAVFHASSRRDS